MGWQEKDIEDVLRRYGENRGGVRDSLIRQFDRNPESAFKSLVDELTFFGNVPAWKARAVANAFFYPPQVLPEPGSKYSDLHNPEISLEDEYRRQAVKMARLFAAKLHMSEEEYISTLPLFPYKLPTTANPGFRMLIVEGSRIPWREQAELSGIEIDTSVLDSEGYPGVVTPVQPYTARAEIWECDPRVVKSNRGANIYEGIAYQNIHYDRARNRNLVLSESRDILGRVSILHCSPRARTRLYLYDVSNSTRYYVSNLLTSRDIKT